MKENETHDLKKFESRARLPYILRWAAAGAIVVAVLTVAIGFYIASFRKEFRMKSLPTTLSKNVIAVVEGYDRRESESSVLKYAIRADKATTFEDQHQQLQNVFLEVFSNGAGSSSDKLRADKAIYIPDKKDKKRFRIFFAGNVEIDTRDHLHVETDQLAYTKATETAEAEEKVTFSRENLSGSAVGAVVKIGDKTLELLNDVVIFSGPGGAGDEFSTPDIKRAELSAGTAFVDQTTETVDLTKEVRVKVWPAGGDTDVAKPTTFSGDRAKAYLEKKRIRRIELSGSARAIQDKGSKGAFSEASAREMTAYLDNGVERIDMTGGAEIRNTEAGGRVTAISGSAADYATKGEVFSVDGNARIESVSGTEKTIIKARNVVYKQASREAFLTGDASVTQGSESVRGDRIDAKLFPDRSLKTADIKGNAAVIQETAERRTRLYAPEIRSIFGKTGHISKAVALGGTQVSIEPRIRSDYSEYRLTTKAPVSVGFRSDGKPANANSDGRTTIRLISSASGPDASDKTLSADSIESTFRPGTDELESAVASGDAQLLIEPKQASKGSYQTDIRAPRFVCDFFGGNNAKSCVGTGGSTAKRRPVWSAAEPIQTLKAATFTAKFDAKTQNISALEASGDARFTEGKRNGIAGTIVYTEADRTVRLRGGEPVIWDESGRVRAQKIDWDVKNDRSAMAGSVRATYYSQKQSAGAAPFAKVNSPVFVTSASAEFDHKGESAVFTGDARAWQEKNYVRADRMLIEQGSGRFYAEGNVKTLLYDATRTSGGKRTSVPVYAEAGSMLYLRGDNMLRYDKNVDIRQGTDRIRAGSAAVNLDKSNEVTNTVAEKNVIITQPGRKATGSYARYDAVNDRIVLRGDPATVLDEERGSSSGREVIVDLKNNRVTGEGKDSPNDTGRIRSVYKLKDGDLN